MAKNEKKLSQEQFIYFLRKNGGIYARTAKDIEKTLSINYTRQAVYNRAQRLDPEELKDIREEFIDIAESGLFDLMQSEDDRVKLQACRDVLRTLGKSRGYVERQEITGAEGGALKTETEINLDNLSIDELKQLRHILRGAINKDGS